MSSRISRLTVSDRFSSGGFDYFARVEPALERRLSYILGCRAGRFDRHLAKVAAHGLRRRAVAGVAAAAALGGVRRVAQMLLHLQFEECFESLFHQALHDGFCIHPRCSATGADLIDEEFLEGLRILHQAGSPPFSGITSIALRAPYVIPENEKRKP